MTVVVTGDVTRSHSWASVCVGVGERRALWSRSILLRYLTETLFADILHTSETKGVYTDGGWS